MSSLYPDPTAYSITMNMQTDTKKDVISNENEPTCIGKIIEEELRRQERTVTWLSRKIHCDRRNIYDIFSRSFIDTGLLWRISKALNTNFFEYYTAAFNTQSDGNRASLQAVLNFVDKHGQADL